jgi:Protein of unknown function (DUF992)
MAAHMRREEEEAMKHRKLAGSSIVLCLATAALAQEARSNIGTLTCTLDAVEAQARIMSCGFKPTGSGGEGRYTGTIRGDAQGPEGKRVLVWTVIGPANMKISPGVLSQRFAQDVRAKGPPSNLVGEVDSSIVLQSETNNRVEPGNAITQVELKLLSTPI